MPKHIDVLLLNPPFAISRPYISIPTLVSYLRKQNISTEACDINSEFYYRFFTRDNIRRGIDKVSGRFIELNTKEELDFRDMLEYIICFDTLKDIEENASKLGILLLPFSDFDVIKALKVENLLPSLTTLPFFPEMLSARPKFTYTSPFFEFCIDDILKGASHESFYSGILKEILQELLDEYKPKIIGISTVLVEQVIPSFCLARLIKETDPSIHVTMGGPFISIYLRDINDKRLFSCTDSFVYDEGEIPLTQLAGALSEDKPDLSVVNNIAYMKDGKVAVNSPADPPAAEESPPPLYTCLDLDRYMISEEDTEVLFRLSKGCQWQRCSFCRTNLPLCRNYQQASYGKIYKDLLEVIKDTEAHMLHFTDDCADPALLEYISENLLADGISIKWKCQTRVSLQLTEKRIELYRRSGCVSICMGVESLNDRILDLMNKGITSKLVDRILRIINGTLPVTLYMIAGFPGETEEEALQGYEKLMSYVDKGFIYDYIYSPFQIMYGSDIHENPEKYGISRIKRYLRCDLPMEAVEFESNGMSREKTFSLIREFSKWRRKNLPEFDKTSERYENEVRFIDVKEDSVALRFSIKEALRRLEDFWELYYVPRSEWMTVGEKRLPPLKPIPVINNVNLRKASSPELLYNDKN